MTVDIDEKQLAAALAASERTRRVLLFLQTYAALLVVVYLNVNSLSGYKERRMLALDARDLYSCATRPPFVRSAATVLGADVVARVAIPDGSNQDQAKELVSKAARDWAETCAVEVAQTPARAAAVADWIFYRRMSARDLEAEINRVEIDMRSNVYNVPIPLTGLRIDINTFSIAGAAGQSLLLVWLLLSIHQEKSNMEMLKDRALADVVIRQMLFWPAENKRSGLVFILMRLVVAGAVLAPLVPLALTAFNDFSSREEMRELFPSSVNVIAIEIALVVFASFLACLCLSQLWTAARGLAIAGPPSPRSPTSPPLLNGDVMDPSPDGK